MKSIMFILLSVLVLFVSVPALSVSIPIVQGDFVVTEAYTLEAHKRYETIDTLSAEALARLQVLRSQKYQCATLGSAKFQCTKSIKDLKTPPLALDDLVRDDWNGLLISLRGATAKPRSINNANPGLQWEVAQKALLQSGNSPSPMTFNKTVYTQVDGAWKLYLGDPADKDVLYFLIKDFEQLRISDTFIIESGVIRDSYDVIVFVQRLK